MMISSAAHSGKFDVPALLAPSSSQRALRSRAAQSSEATRPSRRGARWSTGRLMQAGVVAALTLPAAATLSFSGREGAVKGRITMRSGNFVRPDAERVGTHETAMFAAMMENPPCVSLIQAPSGVSWGDDFIRRMHVLPLQAVEVALNGATAAHEACLMERALRLDQKSLTVGRADNTSRAEALKFPVFIGLMVGSLFLYRLYGLLAAHVEARELANELLKTKPSRTPPTPWGRELLPLHHDGTPQQQLG